MRTESETSLETVLDVAPVALVFVDDSGEIIAANPRARRLLCAGDVLAGRRFDEVLGVPEQLPATSDGIRTVRRTLADGTQDVELVYERRTIAGRSGAMVALRDVTAAPRAALPDEQVLLQKSLLESQSEAAIDGILVVDAEGHILSYNRRFVEMWQIPPEVVESRSDDAALMAVLGQVIDPDAFLDRVRYLYEHPSEQSRDEIRLRDGRTFDRYSAPVIGDAGIYYGRVWFFHDVTDLKRTEESLRFVADASEVLSSSLDPRGILSRLARLAVPRLADWCVLYRVDEEGGIERVALEHIDQTKGEIAERIGGFELDPEARDGVPHVVRTGESILRADATPDMLAVDVRERAELIRVIETLGVKSWMCLPLSARGRTLGAMSFISAESNRRYDESDLRIAEELAHRAALAMDNAKLFQEKYHIARALQESLLPPALPEIPGLAVAARYHAAGEGHDVGGDFYDMFATGGRSWAIVIGDVLGKGPEAAALTALARYSVRTAAMRARKPSKILAVLNEAIYREHGGDRFCTAAYVRVQERQRGVAVTIARGGHPPPIVVRGDGSLETLNPAGWLLGAFSDAELSQTTVDLAPDDALVLYTDGVIEARDQSGEMLGEEGLRALLRRYAGRDADEIADAVEQACLVTQGGTTRDDIAVVVLRVTAAPVDVTPMKPRRASRRQRIGGAAREVAAFEPDPAVLAGVRRFVADAVRGRGFEELEEQAVLLAHELAVNAIQHARSRFQVAVSRNQDRIRVDVADTSTAMPRKTDAGPDASSGRGLMLLELLSRSWGIELHSQGKTVWFELERDGVRATSA